MRGPDRHESRQDTRRAPESDRLLRAMAELRALDRERRAAVRARAMAADANGDLDRQFEAKAREVFRIGADTDDAEAPPTRH
jgi:hypothetical protein